MRTKAEVEKKYEEGVQKLKENPWATLEERGLDPDELAEMRIEEKIKAMQKSPEQLQQESMEKEIVDKFLFNYLK